MKRIRDEQKGIIFIALIVVMVISLSLGFSFSLKTNAVEEIIQKNQVIRSLVVVEDEDSGVLFSSVLIYYPSSKRAALINLPGHTGAIYRTLGRVDKLKTVYKEAGVNAYVQEVEKLLALKLPFYIVIKFDDFIKFTDYLGGLRIFISEPIDEISEEGQRWLLPSGSVNLDGDKINSYVHYRLSDETESDFQERYQNVMAAFITALCDKRFLIADKKNFNVFSKMFTSNVSPEEKYSLIKEICQIDSESIIRQSITGSLRNVEGEQFLMPLNNAEFIKEAVKQTTNMLMSSDGSLSSRVYVLEIQNGTKIQGLARNTSIYFQNASYDVLSAVNADRNDYEQTIIIDHIGNAEVAKMIGEFIHCTNIQEESAVLDLDASSAEASVDFTIILGKDFNGRYVVPRSSK